MTKELHITGGDTILETYSIRKLDPGNWYIERSWPTSRPELIEDGFPTEAAALVRAYELRDERIGELVKGDIPVIGEQNFVDAVTVTVHLGAGMTGWRRKAALERMAMQGGQYWGGEPSVGRWLTLTADLESG
jgi:hypothetical protein